MNTPQLTREDGGKYVNNGIKYIEEYVEHHESLRAQMENTKVYWHMPRIPQSQNIFYDNSSMALDFNLICRTGFSIGPLSSGS